jgi:hypothetical protein
VTVGKLEGNMPGTNTPANASGEITTTNLYPENDGFWYFSEQTELQSGTQLVRYGSVDGNYIAPAGTPSENVSLPTWNSGEPTYYEVVKPFSVRAGIAAPYYNQQGMGIQYLSANKVDWLYNAGYLIKK